MATVLQKLKDEGWYISEEGLKKLNENGAITDVKELIRLALDVDLREIVTTGGYPSDGSAKLDFGSGLVLQVTNVRNMSAPKANQESKTSPRLLQIDMTDGQSYCSGLEMEHLPMFNINIAPGTKVLVRNSVKTIQGIMSLSPQNISILGGKVAALYEKWETSRALSKLTTFGARPSDPNGGGPPPWIPFGQKIQHCADDKSFKSYGAGTGEKAKDPSKENTEFIAMRNEAIAEAIKIGTKKVFGGGNRQLMDHNVKKILDKGYTEEQATYALKMARNNLERAMSSLKRRNASEGEQKPNEVSGRSNAVGRDRGAAYPERGSGSGRGGRGAKNDVAVAAKPSGKVSLFDYLEDKIKIPETSATSTSTAAPLATASQGKSYDSAPNYSSSRPSHSSGPTNSRYHSNNSTDINTNLNNNRSKFENNISSSFASRQKKDDDYPQSNLSNHNNNSIVQHHRSTSKKNESGQPASYGFAGKGAKSSFPPFPASQQQSQHYNRQKSNGNDRSNQYDSSNQYQSQSNQNNYQQNSNKSHTGGRYPSAKSNVPAQNNHHHYNETSNNKHTLTNDRKPLNTNPKSSGKMANMNEIIDGTSNLKISNNAKQAFAQPQSQPHNKFEEIFPQLPKAHAYNPYKIMGFQNKETNEFAMNVLKTQAMDPNAVAMQPSLMIPQSQPNISMHPPRPEKYDTSMQPAIHHIYGNVPPPPHLAATIPNFIVANTNAPVNLGPPPQSSYAWNFKVGDRCLAKYWEDEHYYNAEIQALTDKTCVVHFLDYGNAEEVLLADCLPITDVNHQPINHYNGKMNAMPYHHTQAKPMPLPHQPPQQHYQTNHGHHYHHQMQQQRFRNDRQVYVPPAQRK